MSQPGRSTFKTWALSGLCTVVCLGAAMALGVSAERGAPPAATRGERLAPAPKAQPRTRSARRAPARIRAVRNRELAWSEPVGLTILHTNDIHGQVLALRDAEGPTGLVALGRAIRQERDDAHARGDGVLLLDAGDIWQGTPEGNITAGEIVVDWMNRLRYDAITIGNHEFDYGIVPARKLALLAEHPWLGGNVRDEVTGDIPHWLGLNAPEEVPESLRGAVLLRTLEAGGVPVRVAVIGITSSHTKDLTVKGRTDGLLFADEVETIEALLADLPPADVVIVMTHCGIQRPTEEGGEWGGPDARIAKAFQGRVDVVVGGHSHTRLEEGVRIGDVLVVQAGAKASALGRVRLTLNPPRASGPRAGRPGVEARADLLHLGDDLHDCLSPHLRAVEAKVGLPPGGLENAGNAVGQLKADLRRIPEYESSALGNLLTDLMRTASNEPPIDVAFQNKTGIRSDIKAGPVAWRDVYEVSPFGNTVVTMLMRGSDLRDLLDHMLRAPYRLLEMSGVDMICDPARPKGQRVLEAIVGTEPLDDEKMYVVATNNFLAEGGDGHYAFTKGIHKKDTEIKLRDLVLKFFKETNPYDPGITEQRLRLGE